MDQGPRSGANVARNGASLGSMQPGRQDLIDERPGPARAQRQLRVLHASVQERPKHQTKSLGMPYREQDVGDPHGLALPASVSAFSLSGSDHLLAEPLEPILGNRGEEGLLVGEVVIRCGVRDASAQRRAPESESVRPHTIHELDCCHDERTA